MIEKLNRLAHLNIEAYLPPEISLTGTQGRRVAAPTVQAILLALREPTPAMVEAMRLCTIRNSRPVDPERPFESPFTAAIDAVLAES